MQGMFRSCALALVLSAPQENVAERFHPGEEASWTLEQGGRRLGTTASRYEGEVELPLLVAYRFRGQARISVEVPGGVLEQRFTTELWTDAAGHALRFDFRAKVQDVVSCIEGVVADGQAQLVVQQAGVRSEIAVAAPADCFLLANNFVSQLELITVLAPPESDAPRSYQLFSPNALRTVPYTLKRSAAAGEEGTTVFEDSLGERLHVSPDGRIVRLEMPAQTIVMRRVDDPFVPFEIELPASTAPAADIDQEEVRIDDGPVSLAGTITRPRGASGRLPALFFLSGSGGQDRNGFSQGIDIGTHEILDRLTRDGFLVLRVDDRGVAGSRGPTENLDFDGLVEDGRRALRHLEKRDDVDPARIGLLGHSEGGMSGPLLAASEPVAALVLLAAPGRGIGEVLREQLVRSRVEAGASREEAEKLGTAVDDFLMAIATGKAIDAASLPPELAAFVPARAWVESHLRQDPLANLRAVKCPVLILQGALDVQVSAERDAPLLLKTLDDAKNADHELRVFPTLDHLFKKTSGKGSELDYLKTRPVDPEFLDVLSGWLKARLVR